MLMYLQKGQCFYCGGTVKMNGGQVDHFIPWFKYPIDLAHNFVLADSKCNGKKRDRMPHVYYLARWSERNQWSGGQMTASLNERIACDLPSANRIAYWAYSQTETAGGLTWLRDDELLGWHQQQLQNEPI